MDDAGRRRLRLARPVARQGQSWYRISGKAGEVAEVYIYDEIGWWGTTARRFVDELREITADQIDLHINSPGGDVFDGFAIYQALLDHPARVVTKIDALAASAASFIAMAGETISIAKVGQVMIHDAFGLTVGNAKDHRDMAARLDQISDTIAGVYADRAGGPVEFWRQAMLEESWYTADEAVEAGLADEVRTAKGKGSDGGGQDAEDSWDLSVFTYAGRRQAPAPKRRPAAPGSIAGGEPDPASGELFAEVADEAWAQLGDALDEVFDPAAGYDPQVLSAAILDTYADAAVPPATPPRPAPPRTSISVDELIDAIQEGARP